MKNGLDIDDAVKVVANLLKAQRKTLVEHIERRVKLVEVKAATGGDEARVNRLHQRLTHLESEVRRLSGQRERR